MSKGYLQLGTTFYDTWTCDFESSFKLVNVLLSYEHVGYELVSAGNWLSNLESVHELVDFVEAPYEHLGAYIFVYMNSTALWRVKNLWSCMNSETCRFQRGCGEVDSRGENLPVPWRIVVIQVSVEEELCLNRDVGLGGTIPMEWSALVYMRESVVLRPSKCSGVSSVIPCFLQNQSINTPISPVCESREFSGGGGSGIRSRRQRCDPRGLCHNSPQACVEAESPSLETGGSLNGVVFRENLEVSDVWEPLPIGLKPPFHCAFQVLLVVTLLQGNLIGVAEGLVEEKYQRPQDSCVQGSDPEWPSRDASLSDSVRCR
ncbi:hypothetical protein Tco_1217410 [Tanacetum coccineum]